MDEYQKQVMERLDEIGENCDLITLESMEPENIAERLRRIYEEGEPKILKSDEIVRELGVIYG